MPTKSNSNDGIEGTIIKLLEEFPLYRKCQMVVPNTADRIPIVSINMQCENCKTNQTFRMNERPYTGFPYINASTKNLILQLVYLCAKCEDSRRVFLIQCSENCDYMMKVGQFPGWTIKGDKNIEKMLKEHKEYYKNGLICESQSFGIGAFSYYRRIVEETINQLSEAIFEIMADSEREKYATAIDNIRKTRITAEKIELIKDILPPILRPQGLNPIRILHESLSQGLHAESDENCLEQAGNIRRVLVFLADHLAYMSEARMNFTSGMRELLEKKQIK